MRPAHPHDGPGRDGPPVLRDDLAVDDRVTERHLHPAVVSENPERRKHRPKRHHAASKEVEARRHAFAAEQHDAEERCFQHEGGKRFVTQQRPLDRTGLLRQHAPVGAELERHHDPGYDTHAERHRKDLEPEIEHAPVERVAGSQARALDRRQPRRQADRECREDDMKADEEAKLEARQENRIELHEQIPHWVGEVVLSRPSTSILAVTILVGQAGCVKPLATAIFCAPLTV